MVVFVLLRLAFDRHESVNLLFEPLALAWPRPPSAQ